MTRLPMNKYLIRGLAVLDARAAMKMGQDLKSMTRLDRYVLRTLTILDLVLSKKAMVVFLVGIGIVPGLFILLITPGDPPTQRPAKDTNPFAALLNDSRRDDAYRDCMDRLARPRDVIELQRQEKDCRDYARAKFPEVR